MTKHAHRVSNRANEDVCLVGLFDKHGGVSRLQFQLLITFKFACDSICSFGETSGQESFFLLRCFIASRSLFVVVCAVRIVVYQINICRS